MLHACAVGDRCLVGMGAVVLDGAVVGDERPCSPPAAWCRPGRSSRAAGLWVGSPARRLRALTDAEREFLRYSAAHYVELKNRFAAAFP